ncbi:MAG: DinB family protein [Planctomycetia bacterium]
MSTPLRLLLPPGGFSNLVGHHVAALDAGLDTLKAAARALPAQALARARVQGLPAPMEALRAAGRQECAWLHGAVGRVPSPREPAAGCGLEDLLSWLDAVRTVSLMVLRPLPDRDLERLVDLPGVRGRTSLRRLLAELLEHQAERRAEVRLGA